MRELYISSLLQQATTSAHLRSVNSELYISSLLQQATTRCVGGYQVQQLYISSLLQQATTFRHRLVIFDSCISLLFFSKPQLSASSMCISCGCISLLFFSKPQQQIDGVSSWRVVYLFSSTASHNNMDAKRHERALYISSLLQRALSGQVERGYLNVILPVSDISKS